MLRLIENNPQEWDRLDEYSLLEAAENTNREDWLRKKDTYLALSKTLKEKAGQIT
jgi:hypothetical protein